MAAEAKYCQSFFITLFQNGSIYKTEGGVPFWILLLRVITNFIIDHDNPKDDLGQDEWSNKGWMTRKERSSNILGTGRATLHENGILSNW